MTTILFAPVTAAAFDSGGEGGGGDGVFGGDGCGGCSLPKEIEREAKVLREEFKKLTIQELRNQQILETLCKNSTCGSLTETQASKLLNRAVSFARNQHINNDRIEAKWTTRIGVAFTAFGLLIAWFAYRLSRDADRRSVRNKVEIEQLKIPK